MALSITVNGGGTFTASMEEGPVSFTASLGAVGPQGPAGANGQGVPVGGTTGQVLAKASGTDYDTEWVARNPFDQDLNTTNTVTFDGVNCTSLDTSGVFVTSGGTVTIYGSGLDMVIDETGLVFPDATTQTTALPSGIADGNIVAWDEDTATYLSVPNDARTLFITARNITGTTIPKGSVVLITGASGNRPTIGLAQGDTSANADGVIGITDAAINNNANGRVITEGLADNLNTSDFAAGDKLYLSATTPGGLVNVRPVQPAHSVAVGIVTRSNPAVGSIEVRVQVGEHLEFLHDVLLTSRANGDFLVYESATSLWKNRTLASLDLLTATAAAAVYQPLSGMGSYLTTSAAASTYLTQSNAATTYAPIVHTHTASAVTDFDTAADARVNALVPDASTTAKGKVELATDAEAVAGTSTTLAVTPSGLLHASARPSLVPLRSNNSASATSGSGSGTDAGHFGMYVISGSTSGGYGVRRFTVAASGPNSSVGSSYGIINYDKAIRLTGKLQSGGPNNVTHANATVRYIFGKAGASVAGDLSGKGFGIKFAQGSALLLTVHDGTTLTDVTSSYTPSANEFFEVEIHSDGSGNVTAYVNGSSVATTSAGPTGNSAQYAGPVHFEIENTGTPSGNPGAAWNGGWLFMND